MKEYIRFLESIKADNCNKSQFGRFRNDATDSKPLQNTPITAKNNKN